MKSIIPWLMIVLLGAPGAAFPMASPPAEASAASTAQEDPRALFSDAIQAYASRDIPAALDRMRFAANRGDPDARVFLGTLYLQGRSVPRDLIESHRWFAMAAKQGVKPAEACARRVLFAAIVEGNTTVMNQLAAQGANLNAPDPDGWTPLMVAVAMKDAALTRLLLERGANPNRAEKTGDTALMMAVLSGDKDLARELLGRGARVDVKNRRGVTALRIATVRGDGEMLALLRQNAPHDAAKSGKAPGKAGTPGATQKGRGR